MKQETIFCDRCERSLSGEFHEVMILDGTEKELCLPCKEALSSFLKEKDDTKLFFEHRAHTRGEWMIIMGSVLAVMVSLIIALVLTGVCR